MTQKQKDKQRQRKLKEQQRRDAEKKKRQERALEKKRKEWLRREIAKEKKAAKKLIREENKAEKQALKDLEKQQKKNAPKEDQTPHTMEQQGDSVAGRIDIGVESELTWELTMAPAGYDQYGVYHDEASSLYIMRQAIISATELDASYIDLLFANHFAAFTRWTDALTGKPQVLGKDATRINSILHTPFRQRRRS